MIIGIDTVSSQSGRAFLADFLSRGYTCCGFSHRSARGIEFVKTINDLDGIFLDRPTNSNGELKTFQNLKQSYVGHDLSFLVEKCDFIILSEPSIYFIESVKELIACGLLEKRIPLILSPSRSFSTPYLWKLLGEMYPIASISTCPYSCKAPRHDTSYIKRRKRNFTISLEGSFKISDIAKLGELFPQALINKMPATTVLGNIGAILHPATYILNYNLIQENNLFSFYMDGIASRHDVGECLLQIDKMRLQIAKKIGVKVFESDDNASEEEWSHIMREIREQERSTTDPNLLRKIRRDGLLILNSCIPSIFHWLDYTYGVERIRGESLEDVIRRTPTYQKNSVPQLRYVMEDVPTGLIPFVSFAKRLDVDTGVADNILNMVDELFPNRNCSMDRTLVEFSTEYLVDYLNGKFFDIIE